jgi:hypothetical protein
VTVNLRVKALIGAPALLLCLCAAARDDSNRMSASFSDPSHPGSLRIALVYGHINVKGTDASTAVVIETRPFGKEDALNQSRHDGLRELPQQPDIAVQEQGNRMSVSAVNPGTKTDLEIQVPRRTDLQLSTVNEGDIHVEGVTGELEIGSVNGTITLNQVGGTVVAHTVNGRITATVVSVNPGEPMAFITLNGEVDVTFPAGTKANLKLRTDNGNVNSDFKLGPIPDGQGHVEVNKALSGPLNGGGPQFELRTFNGSVYLRKGT